MHAKGSKKHPLNIEYMYSKLSPQLYCLRLFFAVSLFSVELRIITYVGMPLKEPNTGQKATDTKKINKHNQRCIIWTEPFFPIFFVRYFIKIHLGQNINGLSWFTLLFSYVRLDSHPLSGEDVILVSYVRVFTHTTRQQILHFLVFACRKNQNSFNGTHTNNEQHDENIVIVQIGSCHADAII